MLRRFFIILIILFMVSFVLQLDALAQKKGPKFRHADRNKDGTVDKKEMHMEKKWEQKQKTKVHTWWEKRADTNNDGRVDADELATWKKLKKERIDLNNDGTIDAKERRLCWRNARSRVNTPLEKKYDEDSDGWLEPAEVKELLKDKCALIKTKGKSKVDTEIEKEYDANEDGLIDASEAEVMKGDAQ